MYIWNRRTTQIDPFGMELRPEGPELFNVVANDADLRLPLCHLFGAILNVWREYRQ
ncbi:MAG: hypothetical protein IJH78_06950 [Clostridia bacterium]|nr:hypothetical protein [Clostridia bacterium]